MRDMKMRKTQRIESLSCVNKTIRVLMCQVPTRTAEYISNDGSEQRHLQCTTGLNTLCLKKVPTFKLSVTSSNLNRFSKCLHCLKADEMCYKTYMTLPTSP